MNNVAAVILAAGISSRMGRFKPMLNVDGETMISRVVHGMKRVGASPIVVVTGYKSEVLTQHLAQEDVVFVHNERYYETQMLDSLVLGLEAIGPEYDRVLISPADVPLVQTETVLELLQTKGAFVRPIFEGAVGHPVIMDLSLLPVLQAFDGQGGLRAAVEGAGVSIVDVEVTDRGTTLDGDTREEYANLLRYHRQQTNRPQLLQLDLRICLQAETQLWGPGTAQFLELIETTGSIQNACSCMHMAYSKGWNMINETERQLSCPILIRSQGGAHGGGSHLSPEGKRLLDAYRAMAEEIQASSEKIFQKYFPGGSMGEL